MTEASYSAEERRQIFAYQEEGYRAYLEGKHPRDIPYKHGDPGSDPWIRGFNQARTDRAIENRKVTP